MKFKGIKILGSFVLALMLSVSAIPGWSYADIQASPADQVKVLGVNVPQKDQDESKTLIVKLLAGGDKRYMNWKNPDINTINPVSDNILLVEVKDKSKLGVVKKFLEECKGVQEVTYNNTKKLMGVPNDPSYSKQWGMSLVKAPQGWSRISALKKKVIVAVIDTGINSANPDLKNRIAPGGYNFHSNSTDVSDSVGHGTSVSGVIAAQTNNGIGVSGISGTFDVKIMPLKVASPNGTLYESSILKAINYAISKKVDVINMSLGSSLPDESEESIINKAVQSGITVVAAAGNDGDDTLTYPASYPEVISVASVSSNGKHSNFSNYNSYVDVAAPGDQIYTTTQNSYGYVSGTSFSSPMVAGIAALLKGIKPELSPQQIDTLIKAGCVDAGAPNYDVYYGYGIVNLEKTVLTATQKLSSDTSLKGILLNNQMISGFSQQKVFYDTTFNTDFSFTEQYPYLTALPTNPLASVVITQPSNYGGIGTIKVISPDKTKQQIYQVRVNIQYKYSYNFEEEESNDSYANADFIYGNSNVTASITNSSGDIDVFDYLMNYNGRLDIGANFNGLGSGFKVELQDSAGKSMGTAVYNSTTKSYKLSKQVEKGEYYIVVSLSDKTKQTLVGTNYILTVKPNFQNTTKRTIEMFIGNKMMTVNGMPAEIDYGRGSVPIIQYPGKTMVPIKTIIDLLGGTTQWYQSEQKCGLIVGSKVINLWIGKYDAKINNVNYKLEVKPILVNSKSYLPLKFVVDALNGTASWTASTRKVTITFN